MSLPSPFLQDNDDDDDEEFIPDVEDEDDDFSRDDNDESSETDQDFVPPFLQGYLMADPSDHRAIVFKDNGSFYLRSDDEIPSQWSISSPLLSEPVSFSGWIGDLQSNLKFQVQILEKEIVDALDEKLLQAQLEKMNSKPEMENESIPFPEKSNQDLKEPARGAKFEEPKCTKKRPPESSKQAPMPEPASAPATNSKPVIYSITGTALSHALTFRGAFRPDGAGKSFVICTTIREADEEHSSTSNRDAAGVSVASKRKRDDRDSDNEETRRGKVDFQELIDLHEDAMRHHQKGS